MEYSDPKIIESMFKWYSGNEIICETFKNSNAKCNTDRCTLSRFVDDDGFYVSSNVTDYAKNNVFDTPYSHKYLDSRHLSTILLGGAGINIIEMI